MAHTGINDATAWLAVGFDNFLEQEHVRLLNGPSLRPFWDEAEPPTLMDLIELWVTEGDATHTCGSYEMFLLAVIIISEQWQYSPMRGLADHRYFWREPGDVTQFCDEEYSWDGLLTHPALSRTLWDVVSARQQSQERHAMIQLANKLTEQ